MDPEPTNPSSSPEGPLALVTGASRGIGATICRRLARTGASVLIAARTTAACQELADEIERSGGRARALTLDVGDPDSIREALRAAQREGGPVRWLVNNAGIAESAPFVPRDPQGPDAQTDLYERHLEINFHGARRVIEAFLPGMREVGQGRIVNVASSAGLRGYPYVAAYCASKFALVGYTLAAAQELTGSGIHMNAVCPHYVDSPMLAASVERLVRLTKKSPEEARAFFAAENPAGILVTQEQVAEAVFTLLAGESSGKLIELDGSTTPRDATPTST